MHRKYFTAGAALLLAVGALAVGALTGCASGVATGSVVVEVRDMPPHVQGDSYDVEIIGLDGTVLSSFAVNDDSTRVIDDDPFGWIAVEASATCRVEAELSPESPTIRMTMESTHCTLSD